MYVPDHFRVEDVDEIHALMRARPFATLVSAGPSGLMATHLPTVLKTGGRFGVIHYHLARANPHWKDLVQGDEALMIFQGAEGYVTPRWYPSKAAHGKVVPTWNYAVVHAYGRPEVCEDRDWLKAHVSELVDQQEQGAEKPWAVSDAPDSYVDVMLRGIVGFRFEITRLQGKWKMSQNREDADRVGVVEGLKARGDDADLEMAALVEAKRKP
jgi:transcriptional regulator